MAECSKCGNNADTMNMAHCSKCGGMYCNDCANACIECYLEACPKCDDASKCRFEKCGGALASASTMWMG